MKNLFETVIRKGGYDLNTMLSRIDEYHISGKLTDGERLHLIAAARGQAEPQLELSEEVQRLTRAVRDLQTALEDVARRLVALEGGELPEAPDTGAETPDYAQPTGAHDAYFTGDCVRYAGVIYRCVAPAGVACVWSPEAMPDYWQVVDGDA